MLRIALFCAGVALFCLNSIHAQQRTCASHDILLQQLKANPEMQQIRDAIENHTANFAKQSGATDRTVVTIPVVVHVVWNTPAENLSVERIQAQIDVLNADFRHLNADQSNTPAEFIGFAADCEVEFCMAERDPNGNATDGIVRVQTSSTSFGTNDAVKFTSNGGSDAWPRDQYLNIWVCDLSGFLGYAQFPGGPANTDGVVCDYLYFGTTETGAQPPFDKGRTATHEVGHWLNCYHIWGDDRKRCNGSDLVDDTPNQADENYGCPNFPEISCSNGPNGDMFMNYMDYTDDACMNMFTLGQKTRMQSLFSGNGFRVPLLSSLGCVPPGGGGGCFAPTGLAATNITQTSATLGWNSASGATAYNLQWKASSSGSWNTESGLSGTSFNLTGLSANTSYDFQVQTVCGGSTSSYGAPFSFFTQTNGGGGGCEDIYEPNNNRNSAAPMPLNEPIQALIDGSSDNDYFVFNVNSSNNNIKIDLTSVPADYDLKLYRNNSNVATSENPGTNDEQIIYNNANTNFDYYARVYGYAGANDPNDCYVLQVSLSNSSWRSDGSTDGKVTTIEIPINSFGMWPNPASDHLIVEVPVEADSEVQVSLFDPTGKATMQQHRRLAKGDNQFSFDLDRLSNGVYFVQVRNGDLISTRKLVVTK